MYLKRYHDVTISSSGVWRILHKVGLGRLPASQRYKRKDTKWKRYEKQRPGHALQVDVKFIEPLGQTGKKKRYYQYTAIDDCTRVRVLRAYPKHDQKTAIQMQQKATDLAAAAPYGLEVSPRFTVFVSSPTAQRVAGATEFRITVTYQVRTLLSVIGIGEIPLTYTRPIFVIPS